MDLKPVHWEFRITIIVPSLLKFFVSDLPQWMYCADEKSLYFITADMTLHDIDHFSYYVTNLTVDIVYIFYSTTPEIKASSK